MRWQENRWWDKHSQDRRKSRKPEKQPKQVPVVKDRTKDFFVALRAKEERVHLERLELEAHIKAIVAKFSLKGYRYPMTAQVFKSFFTGAVTVQLNFKCQNRDNPAEEVEVGVTQSFHEKHSEDLVKHILRDTIKKFVLHEMDECLFYDDKREWDPHKYDRPLY